MSKLDWSRRTNRHIDYSRDSFEKQLDAERSKPTAKQKQYIAKLISTAKAKGIKHSIKISKLKTREDYSIAIGKLRRLI